MEFPFGRTVTIIGSGGVDQYGDPIADAARTDIDGCAVAPRTSFDITGTGRFGVIVGLTVLFPDGTAIEPTDQFEIDGVLWQIEGVAGEWVSPFTGWRPGIEVALARAAG